jgi:predicted DNA-binding antitoxin AbrB/MazE fold protein
MTERVTVRYQNGVFVPLDPIDLPEQEYVIDIDVPHASSEGHSALVAWQAVYEGLSPEELDEVERLILDRTDFMEQEE